MSLDGIFKRVIKEAGLEGFENTLQEEKTSHLIEGSMNVKGLFEVLIKVDPNIEASLSSMLSRHKAIGSVEDLMYTVVVHENGHWKVCPFDIEFLEEVLAGVSKGLYEGGIPKKKMSPGRVWAKANDVMDIIVNIALSFEDRNKEKWKRGRGVKYLIEAVQELEVFGVKLAANNYPKDYGIFVDTQMRMYNPDFRWLAPQFTLDYQKIEGVIEEAIAIFSDKTIAKKSMKGPLDVFDLERITEYVKDYSNWYEIGRQYAKLTAPYQAEQNFESSEGKGEGEGEEGKEGEEAEGNDGPQKKKDSKGKKKDKKDKDNSKKDKKGDRLENPFHQVDPDIIKKIMQVSIQKGRDDLEMSYASEFQIYKEKLEARAKDIIIDYKKGEEGEMRMLTISHLSNEKVEKPASMNKFRWSKTKCITTPEDDEWWLYKQILPLQVEGEFNEGVGSLIDILFIVDKSGSMDNTQSCGKSNYELVEEAIAACIKYLKNEKKAYYQRFGLLLFGERDKNIFTKWQSYYELDNFYKVLYEHHKPNDGETILNPNALKIAANEAKDQFLMMMVTDGQLHNTDQAVDAIGKIVGTGNFFTLLQIGGESDFSKKTKKYGKVFDDFDCPEYLHGLIMSQIDQRFGAH